MPEFENKFIPKEETEAQNEQVDLASTDPVSEKSPDKRLEAMTQGILRKIDAVWEKYPKLSALVSAIVLTSELSGMVKDYATQSQPKMEAEITIPAIQENSEVDPAKFNEARKLHPDIEPWRVYEIMNADAVSSSAERDEVPELPRNLQINGFEKFDISNETVESILRETLPKGFLRNISSVRYRDYHQAMPRTYGMNLVESTQQAAHADPWEKDIEIIRGAKGERKSWIANELIVHEAFHLQDWSANSLLTPEEKIELLSAVVKRVESPDRYKSRYVEEIKAGDKQTELRTKSTEYFAEIGAAYMSAKYTDLPKPDKELLDGFIKKMDPHFDRVKALKKRRELIGEKPPVYIVHDKEYYIKTNVEQTAKILDQFIPELQARLKSKGYSDEEVESQTKEWRESELKQAIKVGEDWYEDEVKWQKKLKLQYEKGEAE